MIKIEKGIPIPNRATWKPIVDKMKPGDSILIERKFLWGIRSVARASHIKIATRKQDDKMVRVWRIK